ncbi:MAG: hypothetical protein QOF84_3819 [Streptomyces sp.]|nr:hypothetical protein [Streptomyces sp.]
MPIDEEATDPPDAESPAATVDSRGRITACSAGVLLMLGYAPAEVVGRPATGLLAGALPKEAQRRFAAREGWSGEIAVRHRDGHSLTVELRAQPLLDAQGNTQWFLAFTRPAGEAAQLRKWALNQLPFPVGFYNSDNRLVGVNEAMTVMMVHTEDQMRGRRLPELDPSAHVPGWEVDASADLEEVNALQEHVLRTGEAVRHEVAGRAPGYTRPRAWSLFLYPLKDQAGEVRGVSCAVFDNTDQYWARRRLAALDEAGATIGSTLDVTRTAEELADVAVGRFTDFVSVDLLEGIDRGEEPVLVTPTGRVVFRRIAQRSVLEGCPESVVGTGELDSFSEDSPLGQILATGRGSRYSMGDPDMQRWMDSSPARARSARDNRIHSLMLVPLRARGITMGLALFLRHRTQEPFSKDDLLLAEEIVARAAVCVDNARRYTRERSTAVTLQRSLLPQRMPRQGAVDVASRYLPADSRVGVGGDWFDVIPLSGARVALVVGDVVGHGLRASATMGRLRAAVRTLADVDLPPDELLTQLDDLVIRLDREEGPGTGESESAEPTAGEVGATCLYAVYDPVSRRCTLARAGHPAPAVVAPDGTVELLDLPGGPPLGLGGLPFEATELDLPEGSLLVLYTDGLVEAANHDIDVGLSRLHSALNRPARSLEEVCDTVLDVLLPTRPTDDIALLVARTRALDADQVATWDLPADPAVVSEARKLAALQVAAWGLEDCMFVTELVVSELVTNAIRHAAPPIRLRLIQDGALICEVSDSSSNSPHLHRARVTDEGGRGLMLVAQLTERWGSRQTPTGKTIWAEQAIVRDPLSR